MDGYKRSNTNITKQIAKSYCLKNGRCPTSLDELFNSGATGPYEFYRAEDYFYRSIDDGKDCVIGTTLSNGKYYTELCIGDNLANIKYLIDPKAE